MLLLSSLLILLHHPCQASIANSAGGHYSETTILQKVVFIIMVLGFLVSQTHHLKLYCRLTKLRAEENKNKNKYGAWDCWVLLIMLPKK